MVATRKQNEDEVLLYGLRDTGEYNGKALLMTVKPQEWCRNTLLDGFLVALSPTYVKDECSTMAAQLEFFAELLGLKYSACQDALLKASDFKATLCYKALSAALMAWLCNFPKEQVSSVP